LKTRNILGAFGTGLWLMGAAGLAWSNNDGLAEMTLNQWGDFFAGVVAPVGFLWLILGYLQQGEEVRSNTETLRLQQQALQRQVEETASLARHSEQQVQVATQRLELERQRFERQRALEKARIQPVFAFGGGMGSGAGYQMQFRNNGGMARSLTVASVEPFCEVTISPTDCVEAGGTGVINLNRITSYPTILTIGYVDQDNELGSTRLEFYQPGLFRGTPA